MTNPKYNPNRNGNANTIHHYKQNYNENGAYLLYGNGCKVGGDSCFECPLPDCMWNSGSLSHKIKDGE